MILLICRAKLTTAALSDASSGIRFKMTKGSKGQRLTQTVIVDATVRIYHVYLHVSISHSQVDDSVSSLILLSIRIMTIMQNRMITCEN